MTDPDTISADYSLRPSELASTLALLVEARQPVVVWGGPGCAKSQIAQQVAAQAGRKYVDVRALLLDPVDLRGIPWRDGADRTRWAPPAFLPPSDADGSWLINLEELPSALPMVQAALYQLVLDRKCGEYELPEGAALIACGNREGDRGIVHRMPTPLASRFVHLEIRVDAADWCAWGAANGIAPEVLFFVSMRPELLHAFNPQSTEKAFPCPRTWEMVSNIVYRRNGLDPVAERALFRGTVGEAAAVEFSAFLHVWHELPHPRTVIDDPEGAVVPDNASALIALCGSLYRMADDINLGAIVTYAEVERLLGPILGLGQPDVLQVPLGLGLEGLGQLVQNVAGLVQPAALFARRAVALAQGLPEAGRPVSDGQLGRHLDADLFEAVQARLDANTRRRASNREQKANAPLAGRLFDADGRPMSPTFSQGRGGKLYRYYVSAPLQQGARRGPSDTAIRRISAPPLEVALTTVLRRVIPGCPDDPITLVARAELHDQSLHCLLPIDRIVAMRERLETHERVEPDPVDARLARLHLPLVQRRGQTWVLKGPGAGNRPDPVLVRALRSAHAMVRYDDAGLPVLVTAPDTPYRRRLVRLAFLAPEIQRAIVEGRQSAGLTLAQLLKGPIPLDWSQQAARFPFAASPE